MTEYKKIGKCIYCLTQPIPEALSDEHIIPMGLFGKKLLKKASCSRCAEITSRFEGNVQRHDLKGLRTFLPFPTRHKKNKPKTLPMEIKTISGKIKEIEVPVEDYCPVAALPVFNPPAYLSGSDYSSGIEMIGYSAVRIKQNHEEIAKKYDAKEIAIYSLRWPNDWAKMFAKIGYCFAVEQYGLDKVYPNAYVLDAILGRKDNIGKWVGCSKDKYFKDSSSSQLVGIRYEDSTNEIHAFVKFFAWIDNYPEYHVVVGKMNK